MGENNLEQFNIHATCLPMKQSSLHNQLSITNDELRLKGLFKVSDPSKQLLGWGKFFLLHRGSVGVNKDKQLLQQASFSGHYFLNSFRFTERFMMEIVTREEYITL